MPIPLCNQAGRVSARLWRRHASRRNWTVRTPVAGWWLLALLLLPALLAGCSAGDATWEQVQAEGVLRVGLDPTFPPFETLEGSEVVGFDVDLARGLAEELGVEAQFVHFGYDGLYDALATRQVDVLISALVVQPERTRDFAYSEPYFNAGQLLAIRAGSSIGSLDDLSDGTLAVELGAQGHVEAIAAGRRVPGLVIEPLETASAALESVATGKADAAVVDAVALYIFLQASSSLSAADTPVTVEPYAVVVRIEDETLLREVNRALARLDASGQLQALETAWFGRPTVDD